MNVSPSLMTPHYVDQQLKQTVRVFSERGIENAEGESRELIAHLLECKAVEIPFHMKDKLTPFQIGQLSQMIKKRSLGKPLAYILGEWDFLNYRLKISEDVLIPRPETEELCEIVYSSFSQENQLSFIDVGTGSGCISIALTKKFTKSTVWAVDLSVKALLVAKQNAIEHGVSNAIRFLEGDLLAPFLEGQKSLADGIVANLPYIDEVDMPLLSPEVQREPRMALSGGKEGLELIQKIIPQAHGVLRVNGKLFLEVGYHQADEVSSILEKSGFSQVRIQRDFSGIKRFVIGQKK